MQADTMSAAGDLARKLDDFRNRVDGIIDSDLSAGGQATAIALLVSLHIPTFAKASAVLRQTTLSRSSITEMDRTNGSEIVSQPQPITGDGE